MAPPKSITHARLLELAKRLREQSSPSIVKPETETIKDDIQDALVSEPTPTSTEITIPTPKETYEQLLASGRTTDKYGNIIYLNDNQRKVVQLAGEGKSIVLIGAAGTGKTTTQRAVTENLIHSGTAGVLSAGGHKYLQSGTPGIVICAYTRRAVANIKRSLPADLQSNAITIHKLLEYEPVYYEDIDPETGNTVNRMAFEPKRTARNPLPSSIKVLIFEESSMLGTDLHQEVIDACPHNPQIIYLGDIQQLPPVFGAAILGFKLLELPVVELTEVYRQALESPIISLAHRVLSGNPIPKTELAEWNKPGLTIRPWKKKIKDLEALITAGQFFTQMFDHGHYDPMEDMILLPFNEAFGTIELNKIIANHLARKRKAITHQIVAGFNRIHLSVGDKVMFDKEDAEILKIETNPAYLGVSYAPASETLDYWGHDSVVHGAKEISDDVFELMLAQKAEAANQEDRVKKASHLITLKMLDSDREVRVSEAGALNSLLLGYALTVHKAQGSEWRRVFFICHSSHATMLQRELIYTAITRAREELYVICEPETFVKGIQGQRVKGNTLEEKAEFFKGKAKELAERIR
jgi:exodeoxyribonuclease V alpha subunit